MDTLSLLCSAWPNDNFWATLIKIFDVGSYAWTIILFTAVLKLVLSPMDFVQRFYANKTSRAQAKLAPQLAKLQKQYGQNQTLLYQKQNELYKKNNFSMKGSCIAMLVYFVLSIVIFITLFNSMQYIAGYKIKNQYHELQSTFETEFSEYLDVDYDGLSEPEKLSYDQAKSDAQDKVVEKYLEIKDGWLWIDNIWIADKPTNTAILPFESYKYYDGEVEEARYNQVMFKLINNEEINKANGYYILSVIVLAISLLSQWINKKLSTPKGSNPQQQPGFAKILMFILPITMVLFTLRSSAIFAIYIIVNSLMSTLISPLITLICNKIEAKKESEQKQEKRVEYSRY